MKKILFVVHTLQVGGAEKILVNILKNIDKSKFDITVLALVDDGVFVEEVKNIEGVKYTYGFKAFFKKARSNKKSRFHKSANKAMGIIWKKYIKEMKKSPDKLYKRFVKERYDVEIAFLEGKVSKFVSCSDNKESKKIAWIHTDITPPNIIFQNENEEINCYKKFDKIVCVSREVKNRFIQKTGIKQNICVQINPIDSNSILELAKEALDFDVNHEQPIICTVGRLVEAKGYDRLLEAHKRLVDESIKHKLWIVGEGRERDRLKNYIQKNHLQETVKLFGYKKNPYKYIKNADMFICSSRVEGLSSAVLEATILEKIIVSTDCPGTKDILGENDENALIVENSTEGIYEGLKAILINENLRIKYQENIKRRCKIVNLENTIKQIEAILDK